MIAILDLGIGNLSSVRSGFARVGTETVVVDNQDAWRNLPPQTITGVLLPGVGAFGDAMAQLQSSGLLHVIKECSEEGLPILGICLGMQLLCSLSEEHGEHTGLDLIPGTVVRFQGPEKVPHMGWNDLTEVVDHPLLAGVHQGDFVYFVHSYYVQLHHQQDLLAGAQYGRVSVPAVIGRDNTYGTQFHPEKSGEVGEMILKNFAKICDVKSRTRVSYTNRW